MKIDCRTIAGEILNICAGKISGQAGKAVTPAMTVIQIGDNPASESYIRQKQNAADTIGAAVTLKKLPADAADTELSALIAGLNKNPAVHGIIIQRPIPHGSPVLPRTLLTVTPEKDIDGFVQESRFSVPVAEAVLEILKTVHAYGTSVHRTGGDFLTFLRKSRITVIGKGETAGKPIAALFRDLQCATSIIDSKTTDPTSLTLASTIIVSCVGRERIVTADMIRKDAILISVGLTRNRAGKLVGDYDETEIASKASYYTPTPGGVGPVNVACLMRNLCKASGIL